MMGKIIILLIIFLLFNPIILADCFYQDAQGATQECNYASDDFYKIAKYDNQNMDWNQFDQSKVPANRIKEIPQDNVDVLKVNFPYELTKDQLAYGGNLKKFKEWEKLNDESLGYALSEKTGEEIVIKNPTTGELTENGFSTSAELVKIEQTSVNNCISCVYEGKKLIFKHADSVVTSKSATTNIDSFEGFADIFKVEKADSLLSGCLRFDNIKDSSFSVFDSKVEANVQNGNNITITDCSYIQSEFESKGNGSITATKDAKPKYEIREGTLKCKYGKNTDKIEAENTASVEIDNCFSCMKIVPAGTYFYSDADIRKDFSVNVPKESSAYKLCLRKNIAQQFGEYNGLVDFVNEKIELNGIVNYLRYPLRNSQLSALLSGFVYKGLKDVKTVFSYDNGMIFLSNVNIQNTIKNKNQITITRPNNFYSIEEIELDDGKIHRVVSLSLLQKEDATQSIISNYASDSLDASVKIADGTLIQQAGESKVTILPPGHRAISSFLR